MKTIFTLIAALLFCTINAQTGMIDFSFGTNGVAHTNIATYIDGGKLNATAVQPDGKIVAAAGNGNASGNYSATVLRFNADGTLDNTFNSNGAGAFLFDANFSSIALQTNGKIIAGGSIYLSGIHNFVVARYNTDGSLDATFGTSGYIVLPQTNTECTSVAIQSDGKIVAAGYNTNMFFVRLKTNGTLDSTFNGTGISTIVYSAYANIIKSIALQSDGKIVGAGMNANNQFVLVRLNTDGTLDNNFDGDGKVYTPIGSADRASSVLVQADKKIVAGGYSDQNFALVRYNSDGSLDNSFGKNGIDTINLNSSASISSIAEQTDGKIIAAGIYTIASNVSGFAVAKLNTDGKRDNSFGVNGITETSFDATAAAFSVALQSNNKIIVTGADADGGTNDISHYTIVNYNSDGSLNTSFHSNGIYVFTPATVTDDIAQSILVQPDGKIVTVGYTLESGSRGLFDYYRTGIVRYNSDGTLDNTFGSNGIVDYSPGAGQDIVTLAAAEQSDGKIVTAGYVNKGGSNVDFFVSRFLSNGTLDNTFNNNGYVETDISGSADYGYALAIQPDGKILVAGDVFSNTQYRLGIVRYNADGTLDNSFDGDGKLINDFSSSSSSSGRGILIQPDGKILAFGILNSQFILSRYNSDGSVDNTFNTSGYTTWNIGSADIATAITIQADGKIITVGDSYNGADYDMCVTRFNTNGTLDNSFNNAGTLTLSFGNGAQDYARAVAVQSDNKILIGGETNASGYYNFTLARLNANGSFDNSFVTGGKISYGLNGQKSSSFFTAMALHADKIYMAGNVFYDKLNDFAVLAVQNDAALPLTLLNFSAQRQNKNVLLQWQTANEINTNKFIVERSDNSKDFTDVGTVYAAVKSFGSNNYSFVDDISDANSSTLYYRLKMIDRDGKFTYSKIASVNNLFAAIKIFPNPVKSILNIQLQSNATSNIVIKIADASGKTVLQKVITANATSTSFNVQKLSAGIYYVTVEQNGATQKISFIKQ